MGVGAGASNTTGSSNSFFGLSAGSKNTEGIDNSFFGVGAGQDNTTGIANSFFGVDAGLHNLMGTFNSFFGDRAGNDNTTGIANSFFGKDAGAKNKTGNYNTIIGDSADLASDNLSNATAIGANALVSQSNSMVLGSIKGVGPGTADTKVGIGTDTPTATLTVVTPSLSSGENTATFKTTNNAQNQSHIHFGTTGNWFIRSAASAGKVILQDTGGNVGIGTSAPNAKLQVTGGNVYIANPNSLIITSSNGACWIIAVNNSGALSATSVTCP